MDDIEIRANGKASFVFGREPGWHGLGAMAPEGASLSEIKALAAHFPVCEKAIHTADGSIIDGYKQIVRADGKSLCVMPSTYEVHQADTLWDLYVAPFMADGRLILDAAGSLSDGRKIWVCGRLESLAADVTGKGDICLPFLSFCSSYDGTLKTEVLFHDQRIVCANTLAVARNSAASKLLSAKHTRHSALRLEEIAKSINLEARDFSANTEAYRAMAATKFNSSMLDGYIKAVFTPSKADSADAAKRLIKQIEPLVRWSQADAIEAISSMVDFPTTGEPSVQSDPYLDEILARAEASVMEIVETPNRATGVAVGSRGTLWDAYNGVTEYLTHERGRGADTRLEALWFGPASLQAQRAFDVAAAMAKGAPIPR
jgi:phage/plasmid-like protein (TIGR03299 family)